VKLTDNRNGWPLHAPYRQPEILIMDEATSNLDSESEQVVQQTIRKLVAEGKTIILIAHRLSTVVDAHEIVVLRDGKITEQGNHTELYAQQGYYYQMWQQQMPFNNDGIFKVLETLKV
jgi:ATP-binding cassette subfamily B protein